MRAWAAGVLAGAVSVSASMAAAGQAIDLAGSEWGFAAESGEHARYVQFGQEGLLSGHGGCNRFGGGYVQKDEALTIEGLISTRMACGAEIMTAEDELLRALEGAHHVEATDKSLKILGADGSLLLDLVRRDWD